MREQRSDRDEERAPIVVLGDETAAVDPLLPDGGLRPAAGVENIQVCRTTRGAPAEADDDGYTYAHHMDMACWRGRLYVAWAMTPKDEDLPPYKVVYSASSDGRTWPKPRDLFPRGTAWANRFYFFRAGNGRMLAMAAGRMHDSQVAEANKRALLVREIDAEHNLGDVFTLLSPGPGFPPSYEQSPDRGFVEACRQAVANNLLLEQQDYGVYLGERRMDWQKGPEAPKQGNWPVGKAFCFYHRGDGTIVGLCKMGYVTTSADEGRTWSYPVVPPTLTAGFGKIWGQRTADGRYALVFNPHRWRRFPLVLVHGDDGVRYRDMRVVHGEYPPLRYPGLHKDPGYSYVRGLAEWSDDGSFADPRAIWLVYSVHKEDIWVSRVPLPVRPDATEYPRDDFREAPLGNVVAGWNLYRPRWTSIAIAADGDGERCLELKDADPFDYARAVRVFPVSRDVQVRLRLRACQAAGRLEADLCDASGRRPVRLALTEDGRMQAGDGQATVDVGAYRADEWLTVEVTTDAKAGGYALRAGEGAASRRLKYAQDDAGPLERLSLRTGPWRALGKTDGDVAAADDVPAARPATFRIAEAVVQPTNI